MSINEYAELVRKKVESTLENVTVKITLDITHNVEFTLALFIREKGIAAGATFGVDEGYEAGWSVETFSNKLCERYKELRKNPEKPVREIDIDYNAVKDRLVPALMSVEKNEELLKKVPHIQIFDMALYLNIVPKDSDLVPVPDNMLYSVMVTQSRMQMLGCSFEELLKQAISNESYEMISMMDILSVNCPDVIYDIVPEENAMYVCGNELGVEGAVGMFLPGMAKQVSQNMNSDLVIIPSSINETIVIPSQESCDIDNDYMSMVKEISRTIVEEQNFLSESVYFYDREEDLFRNMETGETFRWDLKDMPTVTLRMDSKHPSLCDTTV